MARKNRTPEENARREKIRELLQMANIGSMDDIQNLFKETIAEFMENGLEAELDDELGYSKYDYKNKDTDNSRNGHSSKTLRTSFGDVAVSVPRDRKGEFEPQVLKKNQTSISQDIEEKILSMYAKGMTTGDIEAHIQDIYGISVSDSTVSRITDKILPIAKEWQQRPLESIYAVVFLDAIHYHVRSEGQIMKKAVYIAIGVNLDGRKDVLGMWVGENESAKFWATVLNSLKNRGVEDIFIACTDNLTGFDAAIHATFPQTEIQNCIIHQLRNSSKYVSYKDLKALMADLKAVYAAVDEQAVDLLMVHGVNPLFLCLCDLKGIIHIMPVLRRGAAGLVVGKTVHFLCSAGRALVDGIIIVRRRRLFCRLFRGFPLWLLLGFLRLLRLWCCRGLINGN